MNSPVDPEGEIQRDVRDAARVVDIDTSRVLTRLLERQAEVLRRVELLESQLATLQRAVEGTRTNKAS